MTEKENKFNTYLYKVIDQSSLINEDKSDLKDYVNDLIDTYNKANSNKLPKMRIITFAKDSHKQSYEDFCDKIMHELEKQFSIDDYSFDMQWQTDEFDNIRGCICTVFYHG